MEVKNITSYISVDKIRNVALWNNTRNRFHEKDKGKQKEKYYAA